MVVMLSTLVEVTCSYAYSLFLFFRATWPLSLVYGPRLQPPSSATRQKVSQAIAELKRGCGDEGGGGGGEGEGGVAPFLDALPRGEDVLAVVDGADGFDVLQHAVIADRKDAVVRLLDQGCSPNRYPCSPPLHLAVHLGRAGMLPLLLEAGAEPGARRGMCFPQPHSPVGSRAGYFGFSQRHVYRCSSRALTPLQCAIQRRRLDCVRVLTEALRTRDGQHKRSAPTFDPLEHLLFACKEGAGRCIQYFVDDFPECLNGYGAEGDTPLLTAVPWGEQCVKVLVDNGADVHLLSQRIGETALHRLYRMNIDGLFTIYDTTRYLLTTGIEQDINALTDRGETPLHMLVSHVSYAGGNYVDPSRHDVTRAQLQPDYQAQVLMAIKELLQFNADPLMLNGQGLQPLSRMLHIALKACHPVHPCGCVQSSQPDVFIVEYQNDYGVLGRAAATLLGHEAPVDFPCRAAGHTPLILLLQCFLYDSAPRLVAQAAAALAAVDVLLSHGANINFRDSSHSTAASLVAMICRRCFSERCLRLDPAAQAAFAAFTDALLRLLLAKGMDANHRTLRSVPFPRGGAGNALIEFVRLSALATTRAEFDFVHRWMLTLLQGGADPDLEPYQSEPVICHSQSSIFLKRQGTQPVSLYLQKTRERQSSPGVSREVVEGSVSLLQLFHAAMGHKALHDCLHAARGMTRFQLLLRHAGGGGGAAGGAHPHAHTFISTVHAMAETPRSLKQIARVAVYRALRRQVARGVDALPLPWAVKQYLLHFS